MSNSCLFTKSIEKKNLIQGILICISCGDGNVIRGKQMLQCLRCKYVNSYEVE